MNGPMLTMDLVKTYATSARDYAERCLLQDGRMDPIIGLWRNGQVNVWLTPAPGNEEVHGTDQMLRMTSAAAIGLSPDFVSIMTDTYITSSPTKTDGTDWERDDMAYAREHNTPDAALVGDALSAVFCDRLGSVFHCSIAYTITDNGDGTQSVVWGEQVLVDYDSATEQESGGYIVDSLRAIMNIPTIDQRLQQWANDPTSVNETIQTALTPFLPANGSMDDLRSYLARIPVEDRIRLQSVMVITKLLIPNGARVALASHSLEDVEKLRELLRAVGNMEATVIDFTDPENPKERP